VFWEGGQQDRWPAQDIDNVTTDHESRSLSKAEPKFAHLDSLRLHSMRPFKKRTVTTPKMVSAEAMLYSKLDITASFDHNLGLTPDEWISTFSLNKTTANGRAMGLPSVHASEEEVYEVA